MNAKPTKDSAVKMAITFAPSDAYQYFKHSNRVHMFVQTFQWMLLHHMPAHLEYKLYLEVSTPKQMQNNQGRLHYHGTITMTQMDYYKWMITDSKPFLEMGRIELDPNVGEKWEEYIVKQRYPMEDLCKESKVIYELTEKMERPKKCPQTLLGRLVIEQLGLPGKK